MCLNLNYHLISSFKLVVFYLNLQNFYNLMFDNAETENCIENKEFTSLLLLITEILAEIKSELIWRAKKADKEDIRRFYSTYDDICLYLDEIKHEGFSILDFKYNSNNSLIKNYYMKMFNLNKNDNKLNRLNSTNYFVESKKKLLYDLDEYKEIIRNKLNKIL